MKRPVKLVAAAVTAFSMLGAGQSLARIIHGGIKTGGEHRLTC